MYGGTGEFEGVPYARLPIDGPGTSPTSVEVVGLSRSAPPRHASHYGRVLKVWLVPKDHPPTGDWWGASACDANERDRRDYWGEGDAHEREVDR